MCFFALFGAGSRKFDAFHECTIIHSYRYNQQQKLQTDQNVNVTGLYLSLITGHSEWMNEWMNEWRLTAMLILLTRTKLCQIFAYVLQAVISGIELYYIMCYSFKNGRRIS